MKNFEIKPSVEPRDPYQKAFQKLGEFMEALKALPPSERERLAYEFFGTKSKLEMMRIFSQYFSGR